MFSKEGSLHSFSVTAMYFQYFNAKISMINDDGILTYYYLHLLQVFFESFTHDF